MKEKTFNGILASGLGSLWWGVIGVLYFKSVSFVSPLELTIHRTVWTAFLLIFSISIILRQSEVFWPNFLGGKTTKKQRKTRKKLGKTVKK